MNLTKKEKEYLMMMIKVDISMLGFLRGFAGLTEADKRKKKSCEQLIKKLSK
jgi:hypothetical protein